jgi:hypothetical protein
VEETCLPGEYTIGKQNCEVTKFPLKVTIKLTLDFANRNISISTVLNSSKLFACCATLSLVVPSMPIFGASVVLNLG